MLSKNRNWFLSSCVIALSAALIWQIHALDEQSTSDTPYYSYVEIDRSNSSSQVNFKSINFKNWGIFDARNSAHIFVNEAWKKQKGRREIVVAVIDTGIDPRHPDLQGNLWSDPSQSQVFGWDFVANSGRPVDQHGHGSHVSGIIAGRLNPEKGTAGVAPGVTIMPLRYYSPTNDGGTNLRNTVRSILWAIERGAHIINYSGGGRLQSKEEREALELAERNGIIVIAAAGNNAQNLDEDGNNYYPAKYDLSNIISVASIDQSQRLHSSSNFGRSTVHVAAPGADIYSTVHNQNYGNMTGTSQATAFVSGVAALVLSENPDLSPKEVIEILSSSCEQVPMLQNRVACGGKINAQKAVAQARMRKQLKKEQARPSIASPNFLGNQLFISSRRVVREQASEKNSELKSPQ